MTVTYPVHETQFLSWKPKAEVEAIRRPRRFEESKKNELQKLNKNKLKTRRSNGSMALLLQRIDA